MNRKGKEQGSLPITDVHEREETACTSRDLLVLILVAAKDTGIWGKQYIKYPELHAFAYLLQQEQGLFQDYIFNGFTWPRGNIGEGVDFPQSPEMTEGLNHLVSLGFFRETTDPLAYEPTSRAELTRERLIERLEAGGTITFDDLRKMAGKRFCEPEQLLQESYQLYIDSLGR